MNFSHNYQELLDILQQTPSVRTLKEWTLPTVKGEDSRVKLYSNLGSQQDEMCVCAPQQEVNGIYIGVGFNDMSTVFLVQQTLDSLQHTVHELKQKLREHEMRMSPVTQEELQLALQLKKLERKVDVVQQLQQQLDNDPKKDKSFLIQQIIQLSTDIAEQTKQCEKQCELTKCYFPEIRDRLNLENFDALTSLMDMYKDYKSQLQQTTSCLSELKTVQQTRDSLVNELK